MVSLSSHGMRYAWRYSPTLPPFEYLCSFILLYTSVVVCYLFWAGSSLLRMGFSLVAASGGSSSLRCAGLSLRGISCRGVWILGCVGFGSCCAWLAGSRVWLSGVPRRLSCPVCGSFPDQGSSPVTPGLVSGFSSAGLPGKSLFVHLEYVVVSTVSHNFPSLGD